MNPTLDERVRFPSPVMGKGPGEYESADELEKAHRAVMWARRTAATINDGERFPSPPLGLGPGEFGSADDVAAAKRAVMWSRMRAQANEESGKRILFAEQESFDAVFDRKLLTQYDQSIASSRNMSLEDRFPSPVLGVGPGEYETEEERDKAKKAVYWARKVAARMVASERFPSPSTTNGFGVFATTEEIEAAKLAVMWSRMRGQIGEASQDRLEFIQSSGATDHFDKFALSEFVEKRGNRLVWTQADERFPSPVLGTGIGEYQNVDDLAAARRAVMWARTRQSDDGRFPSPKLGNGPGDYSSEEEMSAARKAMMWSRLQGQLQHDVEDRLQLISDNVNDLDYDAIMSDFRPTPASAQAAWEDTRRRFPSPVRGPGPGEFVTERE